jgi:hypothetical protein
MPLTLSPITVDLGDTPQNVLDIKAAIGTATDPATIAGAVGSLAKTADVTAAVTPLAKSADVTAAVAPLAKTADVTAAVAPLAKTADVTAAVAPLAKTADVTAAVAPLAKTADVTAAITPLATKADITTLQEEIRKLRSLLCHCWWQDVCWVYLDRDATDSSAVKVFDQVGFREETKRAQITADEFKRACEQHQMQDYLPADHDKLLQALKRFTAKQSGNRPGKR